jgi:hypothetical protein
LKKSIIKIYKPVFNFLNRNILLNNIIIVFYKKNEQQEKIFERVEYFFKKSLILKIKYKKNRLKYLTLLPFVKCHFGLEVNEFENLSNVWLWYNIDPIINPIDAWEYHYILSRHRRVKDNHSIFNNNIHKIQLQKLSKCFLFATGSSLQKAISNNFEDGYKIVCNTIVKDANLWNFLKPDIIVAGDALYHFSDSNFAKSFRKDLKLRLKETPNTIFIFPDIFQNFVEKEFIEFKNRIIGIPIGKSKSITNNLLENFELPEFGNVLNLLMLPIGCTLSKNIYFWGFDGRAPNDKDFWKNSDMHFYQEFIDELKIEHKAFFNLHIPKGREDDYVKNVHGDVLEESLNAAEKKSFKFHMMHNSYTVALQKRITND